MSFSFRKSECAILAIAVLLIGARASGEEPAQRFLDALREQGYHDVALGYLERAKNDASLGADFRATIELESGKTLTQLAATIADLDDREKTLADAKRRIDGYLASHPDESRTAAAQTLAAGVLAERAKTLRERAASLADGDDRKSSLLERARDVLAEAAELLDRQIVVYAERVRKLKVDASETKPSPDSKEAKGNDRLSRSVGEMLQARLARAQLYYELAATYSADSPQRTQNLKEAAKRFEEIFTAYGDRKAGLYALLFEGRCRKELGEYADATGIFTDLLAIPDDDDSLRTLKRRALVMKLETLVAADKLTEAVSVFREAKDGPRRAADETTEEALTAKYIAASAAERAARRPTDEKGPRGLTPDEYSRLARQWFGALASSPGPHQAEARTKSSDPTLGKGPDDATTAYAAARDRGRESYDRLLAESTASGERETLRQKAIEDFQLALAIRPPSAPTEDANLIRSALAYLYFVGGDFREAATLAQFSAERYPEAVSSRATAKIALAALAQLREGANSEEARALYDSLLERWTRRIAKQWPDSPLADEAGLAVLRLAKREGDPRRINEALASVPEKSPKRGEAEILAGQAALAAFEKSEDRETTDGAETKRSRATLEEARKRLETGMTRLRKTVSTEESARLMTAALLSEARLATELNDPQGAIRAINDAQFGPMTAALKSDAEKNDSAKDERFIQETFQTALQAYVVGRDWDGARRTLHALEEGAGGADPARVFFGLGERIEASLRRLREAGQTTEAAEASKAFDAFLEDVVRRAADRPTFFPLLWAAETFDDAGKAQDDGSTHPSQTAVAYYRKAASAYEAILNAAKSDDRFLPTAEADASVRVRFARCLSRCGEYERALDELIEILKRQNALADVQVEAARIYQAWGESGETQHFRSAYAGGRKALLNGKTETLLVWGWDKLARRLQEATDYAPLYFEARYNADYCRLKYAQSLPTKERKTTLAQAERDLAAFVKSYPERGGRDWSEKFDRLIGDVRQAER